MRSSFWSVFSCIWTEYRKIRTRKSSVFGHFSHSVSDECPVIPTITKTRWILLGYVIGLREIAPAEISMRYYFKVPQNANKFSSTRRGTFPEIINEDIKKLFNYILNLLLGTLIQWRVKQISKKLGKPSTNCF